MKALDLHLKLLLFIFSLLFVFPLASSAQSSFAGSEAIGRWDITVKTDNGTFPAWLEIKRSGLKTMVGSYVGAEGSARPISEIKFADGQYSFSIPPQWKDSENDLAFSFTHADNELRGTTIEDGATLNWTGVRAPDLLRPSPSKWGRPVNLLDNNLSKWNIPEKNQFQVVNDVLVNKEAGGNLVTKEKFNDFKIQLEFRYPEGSNSGVYLRGRYEVQIADYFGQQPHDQSIGGVYGFIAPTENAAKKANEWQTLDVTLVGRLVSVVLNGVEVICNRPIPGITGGAIDSDEGSPGPIMIQGDHGAVEFRKIAITPSAN